MEGTGGGCVRQHLPSARPRGQQPASGGPPSSRTTASTCPSARERDPQGCKSPFLGASQSSSPQAHLSPCRIAQAQLECPPCALFPSDTFPLRPGHAQP